MKNNLPLLLLIAWSNTIVVSCSELDLDLELLNTFSLEVLENSNFRRQLQKDMSSGCLNKLCHMMVSFTTCEVFPIQWNKDCAKYFVGYLVECPAFPSRSAITDAPSVCMQDLMSLAGMPNMTDGLTAGNRSDDCQLHCYQKYLERSLDLFESCSSELQVSSFQKVSELSVFQVYRGQVCAMNEYSENCVDLLPDQSSPTPQPNPMLDYSCSYSDEVYLNMCVQFSSLKCCFANQMTILEQTFNEMYAPCVMNRLAECPVALDTDNFCSEGTLRDLSIISVTIEIHLLVTEGLPVMSNYNSTLQFRSIAGTPLGLSPLQVAVMGFEYFNDTASVGEDATAATYGKFSVLLVDAASSNSTWQEDISFVSSPQYAGGIAMGYGTNTSNVFVTVDDKNYYQADPIETSGAIGTVAGMSFTSLLASAIISAGLLFL